MKRVSTSRASFGLIPNVILTQRADSTTTLHTRHGGDGVVGAIHDEVRMVERLAEPREEVENMRVVVQQRARLCKLRFCMKGHSDIRRRRDRLDTGMREPDYTKQAYGLPYSGTDSHTDSRSLTMSFDKAN